MGLVYIYLLIYHNKLTLHVDSCRFQKLYFFGGEKETKRCVRPRRFYLWLLIECFMTIYILHECHVLWVMFEGASCRCAQCTGPVMCEEDFSMNCFFRGRRNFWWCWRMIPRRIAVRFMCEVDCACFFFRGRRNVWWYWRMTSVAPPLYLTFLVWKGWSVSVIFRGGCNMWW